MANYAKNLIGNWEDEQYEPLRDVALSQYQTNWNKLTNDFNNLKDKLERNKQLAQIEYNTNLNNAQNNSYDRMRYAYEDLANRGLSSSGLVDQTARANTTATGQEVDKALTDLLSVSSEGVGDLAKANTSLAEAQTNLNADLADTLAGIGDAEAQNAQNYAGLVADIDESAAARAANASLRAKEKELEDEEQEYYRRLGIYETIEDPELSDEEKLKTLVLDYDMTKDDANSAISSKHYDNILSKMQNIKGNFNTNYGPHGSINTIKTLINMVNTKRYNNLKDDLSKYTYTDLWDLINK